MDGDLDRCEELAHLVHQHDGYPPRRADDLRAFLATPGALGAWVAELDDEVVGQVALHSTSSPEVIAVAVGALASPADALGVVARLLVHPEARRRGVGAALLETAIDAARERGLTPILDVAVEFDAAVRLYERSGWTRIGTVTVHLPDAEPLEELVYRAPPPAPGSSGGVRIRPETPDDVDGIHRVVAAAFGSEVQAMLVERIRSSLEYVPEMALVADDDGEIVGHVMISRAVIRNGDGDRQISTLSPLAVRPDRQRSGIGSALVRSVLLAADAAGEAVVVLEGSPSYYARFGFEPAAHRGIELHVPAWAPPEAAQVVRLASFDPDDPALRGTVVYPAAFDGLEE